MSERSIRRRGEAGQRKPGAASFIGFTGTPALPCTPLPGVILGLTSLAVTLALHTILADEG